MPKDPTNENENQPPETDEGVSPEGVSPEGAEPSVSFAPDVPEPAELREEFDRLHYEGEYERHDLDAIGSETELVTETTVPPERLVPEEGTSPELADVQDFLINIGPHHPGTHGVMRMITRLDGEVVTGLDTRIGYMHRSLEKIAENRGYQQIIAFTDRTPDYLASMHNDWVYVIAAEKLLGITVPERAEYLRVIAGELNRITSHLMSLGALGLDSGAMTYFLWTFSAREKIVKLFEELCGARLTYVFMRLGGVMYQPPTGWVERAEQVIQEVVEELPRFRTLFHDNYIWHLRSKDISTLSTEDARRINAQGPVLRASGVQWDLRRDMPYSIYDRFDFEIPVRYEGDIYARTEIRFEEILESAKIVRQALDDMPAGPVLAHRIPRVPAAPPGEAYARLESPRGEIGCYLVSDGTHKPYRMKWRGASFHNVQMLPELSLGYTLSDLINIVGTIDPVMGDVDK